MELHTNINNTKVEPAQYLYLHTNNKEQIVSIDRSDCANNTSDIHIKKKQNA